MDGLLNTLKFDHKISTDVIKFVVPVQNCIVRYGGCSVVFTVVLEYNIQ